MESSTPTVDFGCRWRNSPSRFSRSISLPASSSPPPSSLFFFLARTHFHEKGRVSTNPILSINDLSVDNNLGETVSASATLHLPSHGQALAAHIQAPGSRRRSPLAPSDGPSPCVPFLPPLWPGLPTIPSHLSKTPGMPVSLKAQNLGARLTPQGTHQIGDSPMSGDFQSSLSRLSSHRQYT